jgi:glycosyltransferase involved in cell wall biosynthesis
MMNVISPMATGNGAYVVHKTLESRISGFHVVPYNPYRTLFPPLLLPLGRFNRADLIHTTPDYAFFHLRKNIPLILTFHNYVLDHFMRDHSSVLQNIHYQSDLKIFTKLAIGKADGMTAVSRFTADLAMQDLNLTGKIKVIHNGVDTALFAPKKPNNKKRPNKINVLFSGNLTRRKGAMWLLPIADKLDLEITINYTSGLQSASSLVNHPQLHCLGVVPYLKMPALYQDSDILLFPTVREGLPMAAMEAMSCGLPVVATNCSSLPELIDDGKGGFLCPLGDVDAFAEKINFLAENPQLRREMGEYNRAKVEKLFTMDRMVNQYKELFETVLSKYGSNF